MTLPAIVIAAVLAAATSVHFPVSTDDPQAQAAIDRGLFLYYAYNGDAAAQSFGRGGVARAGPGGSLLGNRPGRGARPQHADDGRAFRRRAARHPACRAAFGRRIRAGEKLRRDHGEALRRHLRGLECRRRRLPGCDGGICAVLAATRTRELLAAEALLEHGGLSWQNGRLCQRRIAHRARARCGRAARRSVERDGQPLVHSPLRSGAGSQRRRCRAPDASMPPHFPRKRSISRTCPRTTGSKPETTAPRSPRANAPTHFSFNSKTRMKTLEHVRRYLKHDVAVGYSAAMMLGNYATAQLWSARMDTAYDTSFDAANGASFRALLRGLRGARLRVRQSGACEELRRCISARTNEANAIAARSAENPPTHGYLPQLFLARVAEADGRRRRGTALDRASRSRPTAPILAAS